MSLNIRMKELRESKKISQKQLAIELEISDRNYQRYEYGERVPDANTIIKLCKFFNVTSDYLLGIDDSHDGNEK